MPTYEFDMPDGTKKRSSGETPEAAWQSLNTATPEGSTKGGTAGRESDTQDKPRRVGDAVDALQGVAQGWLDPVEGIVQLAEKTTGWKAAPPGIRDWAREFRNRAQSTFAGQAGEFAGNIFNPIYAVPGVGVARGAGLAARAVSGALGGAMAPVSGGGDYWRTKGNQALLGGLTGGTLPALARQARTLGVQAGHAPWLLRATGVPQAVSGAAQGAAGAVERVTPATMGGTVGEAVGQNIEDDDNGR